MTLIPSVLSSSQHTSTQNSDSEILSPEKKTQFSSRDLQIAHLLISGCPVCVLRITRSGHRNVDRCLNRPLVNTPKKRGFQSPLARLEKNIPYDEPHTYTACVSWLTAPHHEWWQHHYCGRNGKGRGRPYSIFPISCTCFGGHGHRAH